MKKIILSLALIAALALNGCERKECLTESVIAGKELSYPDRWLITVENEDVRETLSISKDDWDRVYVGQTVKIPDIRRKMARQKRQH